MSKDRANFLSYLFIIATVAVAAWIYPSLPDPMPSHWNSAGEVDSHLPKPWGVMILPASAIFVFIVFRLIPVISPKGFKTGEFADVLNVFQVIMVGFVSLIGILVMLESLGIDVRLNQVIYLAIGALFIVIGSYLRKVRKNFFVGFRTPWTLTNDDVWDKTHRLGGRLLIVVGLVFIAGAFFSINPGWLVAVVFTLLLVPVIYSYFLYRQAEGVGGGGNKNQ
ncbi:MAG: SdpI family protein [Woeseia sp.]